MTVVGSSSVTGVGSPPPEAVAELMIDAGALAATLTVSVIGG